MRYVFSKKHHSRFFISLVVLPFFVFVGVIIVPRAYSHAFTFSDTKSTTASTPPTPSHPQSFFSQVGDELSAVQTLAAGSWGTLGSSFSLPA
ncbi:MAG: hypothetical protein ACYC8S_01225, partial [Minisyncoccota bacterium]